MRSAIRCASSRSRSTALCVLPNLSRPNTATLLAYRFLTKHPPIIPTIHNFVSYHRYRTKRRYRHLAGTATHFVGVSRGVSASLASAIGVPTPSTTTIYNPVVTQGLRIKMAERLNHPWLLDGGPPVVLAAGRLVTQKDYPTLIKAFARLTTQRPCRLIILGEGKRRKELEGLVQRLRLHDRVALPGWVENPFTFMSRASLFVLSSIHEGMSGVLVQALACGCPCVSTDCPAGPAGVLGDGNFGPLVPVRDEVALAKAMERVLAKPPDRRLLQRRAADFSAGKAAAAYEKLISTHVRAASNMGARGR